MKLLPTLLLAAVTASTPAFAGPNAASPAAVRPTGQNAIVLAALKTRLPKTTIDRVDCIKIKGLCEVTAGKTLFYVDAHARYMTIGRVYDLQTRQDLTAARLLELNPDMLLGGAAKADAAPSEGGQVVRTDYQIPPRAEKPQVVSLAALPKDGAIVWGRGSGPTLTVFTDFHCAYCRALSNALSDMDVKVVERPISVLGSRELSNQVYCAKNQRRALKAAYAGEPLPAASCDTSGLDANEKFARSNGFNGTPVLVRSDGAVIEGYRPKEALLAWLKGGK